MKNLILTLILVVSSIAYSQTAQVIQLSSQDSAEAKSSYQAMKDAEKKWEDFQDQISKKYVRSTNAQTAECWTIGSGTTAYLSCPSLNYYLPGWENGFEFTKDFGFLVPKQEPKSTRTTCSFLDDFNIHTGEIITQ